MEENLVNDLLHKVWKMWYDAWVKQEKDNRLRSWSIKDFRISDFYSIDYISLMNMRDRINKEFILWDELFDSLAQLCEVLLNDNFEKYVLDFKRRVDEEKIRECIIEF